MSRINNTITTLGETVLATLLVTPTSDLTTIYHRQAIIKGFLVNEQAYDGLKKSLRIYKDAEESMISFWTETNPLYTKEYQKTI